VKHVVIAVVIAVTSAAALAKSFDAAIPPAGSDAMTMVVPDAQADPGSDGGPKLDSGGPSFDAGSSGGSDAGINPGGSDAGTSGGSDAGSGSGLVGFDVTPHAFDFGTLTVGGPAVTLPFALTNLTHASVTITELELSSSAPGLTIVDLPTGELASDGTFPSALQLTPIAPTELAGLSLVVGVDGMTASYPITGIVIPVNGSSGLNNTTFYACATRGNDGDRPLVTIALATIVALVIARRRSGPS
jgi:hypothetical protein